MRSDNFGDIMNILKNFGKSLSRCLSFIMFWIIIFIPFILGIAIGVVTTNLIPMALGFIIEIIWVVVFLSNK